MLLLGFLPLLLLLCLTADTQFADSSDVNFTNWPTLSPEREYALRSQRDVSANISMDQVVMTGVQLSTVLFQPQGYTLQALEDLRLLLDVNVEVFLVDLFLDQMTGKYQLCPISFSSSDVLGTAITFQEGDIQYQCEVGVYVDQLLSVLDTYLADTDTNLAANPILVLFNLKLLPSTTQQSPVMNESLSNIITNYFKNRIYTPDNLYSDRSRSVTYDFNHTVDTISGYPDLSEFLFTETKRIIVAIWNNNIPSNTSYNDTGDSSVLFNQGLLQGTMTTLSNFTNLTTLDNVTSQAETKWSFIYDDNDNKFTNDTIREMLSNGYFPIINHTLSDFNGMGSLLNNSLWSWSPSEPINEEAAKDAYYNESTRNPQSAQSAFKCATLNTRGEWQVKNCYDPFYAVCRRINDQFKWVLINQRLTYFDASTSCSDGYYFTVPQSSLQQRALMIYLDELNMNESVWIDMNSIAVSDCWVSGGPYASCPYQTVSHQRNFIEMLIPAAVVCGCLLFSMFLLRFKPVPVQDNRKHWKKIINNYTDNEYEGVPS